MEHFSLEGAPDALDTADDGSAFYFSLNDLLARIAPLTATTNGMAPEERVRRLAAAVNLVLDTLTELTGVADAHQLPELIERLSELMVTGNDIEIQLGVAGDLRIDKKHRLNVNELLQSCGRIPASTRPGALREAVNAMQRLLALLILHGWTDGLGEDEATRQASRQAIVETVQGRGASLTSAIAAQRR